VDLPLPDILVSEVWQGIHAYGRPGVVQEYFHAAGGFGGLSTRSLRGLPRPADDTYADRLPWSDPVYAAWGEAAGVTPGAMPYPWYNRPPSAAAPSSRRLRGAWRGLRRKGPDPAAHPAAR
jgi:hypothetical protein